MKIDPKVQSSGQLQADALKDAKKATARGTTANSEATGTHSGDTIEISSKHAEVRQLTEQMTHVPEVRSGKVAPLKAAVERKTYKPDSGKVADAMITEHSRKVTNS